MADPDGVVMVFIDDSGRPVANAADFDQSGYGGFTLQQAQEMRTRRALSFAVVNAYCSPQIVRVFEPYDCEQFMSRLVSKHGCRIAVSIVGHGTATAIED